MEAKELMAELDYRNSLLMDCYANGLTFWRWIWNRRRIRQSLDQWCSRQLAQNTRRVLGLDHPMQEAKR